MSKDQEQQPGARRRRSRYTIDQLLANTDYPLSPSEREWVDAPDVGREPFSSHKIEDLLAQCDFSQPRSAEDEAWMNDPAKGKELL
ncbi:MAG: hypothetical protein ACDS79_04725 [Enterobacteriaceae bacterium]